MIRNLEGPVDGRHVVHQALNHLFGNRPEFAGGSCVEAPLGGGTAQMLSGGQFGTSQPIPVFRADLDRIRDTSFLSEVRRIGWRYLVVDRNGAVAIADVRETGGGGVVFSRMTPGLPAERLLRATRLAAGTYGDKVAGNYELRILEIPALSKSALWLHQAKSQRKQDVFFPIMGGYKSDNVQEDPSFMDDAVHIAAARPHFSVSSQAEPVLALWPTSFPQVFWHLKRAIEPSPRIEATVRQLAYEMWTRSACKSRAAWDFWLAAEKHVLVLTAAVFINSSPKTGDALSPLLSALSGATHLQLIEGIAHSIWEQEGRQIGSALDHWLAAEKQVLAVSVAVMESSRDAHEAMRNLSLTLHNLDPVNLLEPIRALAEAMWEQAGGQSGFALDFWVAAEKHVLTLTAAVIRQASAGSGSAELIASMFSAFSPLPVLEMISETAQKAWLELGRKTSQDVDNWLNAEREVLANIAAGKRTPSIRQVA